MMYTLIVVYLLLSLIVAYAGTSKRVGFWGSLLIAVILTPVIGFIIVSLSQKKGTEEPSENVRIETKPPLKGN